MRRTVGIWVLGVLTVLAVPGCGGDEVEPQASQIEIDSVRRESDRMVVRGTRRTGCWEHWLPTPPFRAYQIVRMTRLVAPVDLHVADASCHRGS